MDLFRIMFGDLTEVQKAILDKAIDLTYARAKINADGWRGRTPPVLGDLYRELERMEKRCAQQEKITYRALLNRLMMYVEKGVFSFLNQQTNIDFSSDFVCFNIGAMPKQVKPVVMFLILDFLYMRMKSSKSKKLLVIDEAWAMLQGVEESSYVFEIVKTCRKFNLGLLMITQDVADLLGSKAGNAVLSNISYTFLLKQKASVIHKVMSTFHLSDMERDYLISTPLGNGLLILENEHQEIEVIASEKEHELITTNPNEKIGVAMPKKEVQVDLIDLDIEQDVHTGWDKTIDEKNFLANNGYVQGYFHNLQKGRQKEYFVKKKPPESALHTYYVDLIYQEIRKYTEHVKKSRTKEADLIFSNNDGRLIAIEVETGKKAKFPSKKSYIAEKFKGFKKRFGDNAYIFLISVDLKNSYTKHGVSLLFRLDVKDFVDSQFRK